MRNLKKFLALVLAMVMAASLMVTANAAVTANVEYGDDYTVDELFTEAVTVLSGMGVIQGYDDGATFGPQRLITRAEAAALIYRLATGDVTDDRAKLYADYSPNGTFADVRSDAWYAGYVGYCANFGIAKGRSDGLFHPTDNVTGYEILAMILRVVGYDKKGEFTGSDWQYNVSTLSTSLGVLNNVKTYNYSKNQDTLYGAATREVVASLLFETITRVPMVTFSEALSYMTTGMTGGLLASTQTNPTVGYNIFGLRSNHGIVVGNADTGEGTHVTKIGFDVKNLSSYSSTAKTNLNYIDDTLSFSRNTAVRSAYVYESGYTGSNGVNATLAFKWDSGLDYFGHMVKVWYSDKTSQVENVNNSSGNLVFQMPSNFDTYAVFDETPAENIQIVSTRDTDGDGSDGSIDLDVSGDDDDLANLIDAHSKGVYWNYAFGPTEAQDYQTKPSDSGNWDNDSEFESPILNYDGRTVDSSTKYPLYMVISNNPDGKADIVIALEMTITQITQVNSVYTKTASVGVFNANSSADVSTTPWARSSGNDYFDTYDNVTAGLGTSAASSTEVYTQIAQASLTGSSSKTLGDKVVAIAITGTKKDGANGSNNTIAGNGNGNYKQAANALNSTAYYQLNKLTNVVPGTVYTVKTDGTVVLADGSTMEPSPYRDIVDASFATASGVKVFQERNSSTFPQSAATYQFTLDREGRYIYWEPLASKSDFVYATYLDYVTDLNSSTYKYSITAVNDQGERRQVYEVTKWDGTDFSKFNWNENTAGYNANQLPKRDSSYWGTIQPGRYIGYTLSGTTLTEVTRSEANSNAIFDGVTMNKGTGTFDRAVPDANGHVYTTITSTDALIGAKEVSSSELFLTEDTVFHIVSGAGTDTQDVKTYHGLSELLAGNRSVVIDGGYADKNTAYLCYDWNNDGNLDTNYTDGLANAEMIYYSAKPFTYSQNYGFAYTGTATAANVVYLPANAVTFNKATSSSLYFVGDNNSSTYNAIGENAVLFTMYKDGEEVEVWVEGKLSDTTATTSTNYPGSGTSSSAGIILTEGPNVFYGLEDTGKKTNFNEPIYKVVEAADANSGTTVKNVDSVLIGYYWNGDDLDSSTNAHLPGGYVLSGSMTGTIGTDVALYNATTNALQAAFIDVNPFSPGAELYNVTNAKVANAGNKSFSIKNLSDLHNAGALYDNMGVPVSCVLSADSSRVVDFIYVNK